MAATTAVSARRQASYSLSGSGSANILTPANSNRHALRQCCDILEAEIETQSCNGMNDVGRVAHQAEPFTDKLPGNLQFQWPGRALAFSSDNLPR
jgi:hypothetical protein